MSKLTLEDIFQNHRDIEIERSVREVHGRVWSQRRLLWKGNQPSDLIGYLEPAVALHLLDYRLVQVTSIGEIVANGGRYEVAGEIDTQAKTVKISNRHFARDQRYTLAHEVGHAVLHPNMGVMHRDLPFGKSGIVTDRREVDANRFASGYLMPWRLILAQYETCFEAPRVALTEHLANGLFGMSLGSVRRQCRSPRAISLQIARATSFGGKSFRSLASQFQVSPTVMAIRLEEMGLSRSIR